MVSILVDGMSCDGCVRSVTKAVLKTDPAAQVSIDLAKGRVDVVSDVALQRLVAAIEEAGYDIRS